MVLPSQARRSTGTKHKIFLSYYHKDDQNYRDYFESYFRHTYITRSVQLGDINSDNSTEYIKRLIQEDYISDASVVVVLVGPRTRCRKHVDWEISAGLNRKVGGCSGLLGILLPEFPLTTDDKYRPSDLPPRLNDNVQTGYASLYWWKSVVNDANFLTKILDEAFDKRQTVARSINNHRLQMQRNTCD